MHKLCAIQIITAQEQLQLQCPAPHTLSFLLPCAVDLEGDASLLADLFSLFHGDTPGLGLPGADAVPEPARKQPASAPGECMCLVATSPGSCASTFYTRVGKMQNDNSPWMLW